MPRPVRTRPSPPCRLAWGLALTPLAGLAQGPAPTQESGSFVAELVSIVLPLAFIILILFAILRLARRRYGRTGQDASLSVVQILPLGPRERIVLVRTRTGRVFAVGVGAQAVTLLTDLDPADVAPDERIAPAPTGSPAETASAPPKVLGLPLSVRDLLGRGRHAPRG